MRKSQQFPGSDVIPPYPLVQEESCRGGEREKAYRRVSNLKKKNFFCVCVFFNPSPQTICHLRKKKDLRVIPIFLSS